MREEVATSEWKEEERRGGKVERGSRKLHPSEGAWDSRTGFVTLLRVCI